LLIGIQTIHAKLGSQDGNSREHVIRSQMVIKWNKGSLNWMQLWSELGSRYLIINV